MPSLPVRGRPFSGRLFGLSLLALLIGGVHSYARDKIDPAALKKVKAATVHIKVQFADGDAVEGSGFVTRQKGLIVTNAHVIGMLDNDSKRPSKVEVTFNSGEPDSKTVEVKVEYVDGDSDIALLKMSPSDLKVAPEPLPVALSQFLKETQDVFIVGFPLGKRAGDNITVTPTAVTSLRKEGINIKRVQVNGGMHPGNSGGPVVDKDGNLVGIAVAGFAGTQVHLAIPTEILNSVFNGRIVTISDVAYRDGDKIKVPFRIEKADPLDAMKTISVETWIGKPGPTRPSTNKKPDPLPDDSSITVLEVKPDAKGVYSGELVLDANKDPKMVYWSRYLVGRGGDRVGWYPGNTLSSRVGIPVDRKPATIKYEPPLDKTDVLAMNSDASFRIREPDGDDTTLAMTLTGTLQEKATDKTRDGKWRKRLTYDGIETTITKDKKPPEGAEVFLKALKDAHFLAAELVVEKDGSISKILPDDTKVPKASQRVLTLVSRQVLQSLDSLAPPLPLKEVAPLETWKGKQDYLLGVLNYMIPAKAEVTYRYEGTYMRDKQAVAVVSFEGALEPDFDKPKKGAKEQTLTGKVEGKIELFADTGVMQFATEKIRAEVAMESEGKTIKLIGTLNVNVRRNPPAPPKKK
jgi:S1-C subfamily serine protease